MTLQVGVKVVLRNNEGKILLLKRSAVKYGSAVGSWDIPGGRIDPGTSLQENLSRELEEETKLSVTDTPKLIAAQDIFPTNDKHIVRLTYVASTIGEPVLDGEEHSESLWVSFDELSTVEGLDGYCKELILSRILTKESWN
jgi:8-oxo-dGTP diphosphatase